jgi:hypothetical protein
MNATFRNKEASFTQNPYPYPTLFIIHSKLRNSLSPKTVEKLVFIKSNLPTFCENEAGDDNDYQSDCQLDDSVP